MDHRDCANPKRKLSASHSPFGSEDKFAQWNKFHLLDEKDQSDFLHFLPSPTPHPPFFGTPEGFEGDRVCRVIVERIKNHSQVHNSRHAPSWNFPFM